MIQMLGVMEKLWKYDNLDLRMTRYQVNHIITICILNYEERESSRQMTDELTDRECDCDTKKEFYECVCY